MKMRTKIALGTGFMFVQLLVVSMFGLYSSYTIATKGKSLFVDNALSIEYTENILSGLDMLADSRSAENIGKALVAIDDNIAKEEKNITEPGERDHARRLRDGINLLGAEYEHSVVRGSRTDVDEFRTRSSGIAREMTSEIRAINRLNLAAIREKNGEIAEYESRFYVNLAIITTLFLLVSFSFLFNFPSIVFRDNSGRGRSDDLPEVRKDGDNDGK